MQFACPVLWILVILGADAKVIDLSHTLMASTYAHSGIPHYNRTSFFYGELAPGVFADYGAMMMPEHAGTHMDSPSHFVKNGLTLDELTVEDCIADGVMIDCSKEADGNREYIVPVQKLLVWEKEHGRIPDRAAVVFNFDWSKRFTTPTDYTGTNDVHKIHSFSFPSVSPAAGRWLVKERDIKIIATDTATPDAMSAAPTETLYPIHREYLREKRLIIENIKDAGKLPPRGFRLYAVPYKFKASSGAPTRTFAITHDEGQNDAPAAVPGTLFIILISSVSSYMSL